MIINGSNDQIFIRKTISPETIIQNNCFCAKKNEKVLCVESLLLEEKLKIDDVLGNILEKAFFIARKNCEENPYWKQVIPYMIFRKNDGTILTYQKTKKSTEKRLHGFSSIGIGGHINPCDDAGFAEYNLFTFRNGATREIREEIGIILSRNFFEENIDNYSYINIEGGASDFHFGVCMYVDEKWFDPEKIKFSDEVENIEWLTLSELEERKETLESWSQYVLELMWKEKR